MKLFSTEDILDSSTSFHSIDIHGNSDIDINDISSHFFGYFEDTFHSLSAVTSKFKRNINEELQQAMSTSSDIKAGKNRIFKKDLNAGHLRRAFTLDLETADLVTFTEEILNQKLHFLCSVIYSVLSAVILKWKKIAYLRSV